MDMYSIKCMYVCMYEIYCYYFYFIRPIYKNKIVYLVFVAIHEQEISASSAEPFRGDSQLYLSIKLLNILFAT